MLYPKYCLEPLVFFFGGLFVQADGFNYAEIQGQIWLFPCVDPEILTLKSHETFSNQPPNMSCFFSARFEQQQQQQQNKQACEGVLFDVWAPKILVQPFKLRLFSPHSLKLPKKKVPNAPNDKLQLPTVDFQ